MFELTAEPLDAEKLLKSVRRDEAGAVVLFYGVVRNENMGRRVLYLEYDAYPEMAEAEMGRVADDVRARWPDITGIAVQHRTGRLEIGEPSLLIAVSAPHRREAFEAAHAYVDLLKERVPVWKKEVFEGGEEWIEGDMSRRK
jgi:molybdopterin synthase catalytic subunit